MYIGIDLGGTSIKYAVVNEEGNIFKEANTPTPKSKEALYETIQEIVSKLAKEETIKGIGISAPGVIQQDGYMTTGGAIDYLYDVQLKEELSDLLKLPVYVENDANAAAIAEHWVGHAQNSDNYLCLVLGTGVGGGIIINGQVFRGAHGMAGEFGYMLTSNLDLAGHPEIEDQSQNRLSAVVGGLCRQYYFNVNKASDKQVPFNDDASQIIDLAQEGDVVAKQTLDEYYTHVATGILNLVSAFDPEVILIGGGISTNELFFKALEERYWQLIDLHDSLAFLKEKTVATIRPTKLQNNAGLIGAVYQVQQSLK